MSGAAAPGGAPLAGRTALVTGASRGIGAAAARRLAAAGAAAVAVHYYQSAGAAAAVAADCRTSGAEAEVFQADLRLAAAADELRHALERRGWTPDIVVHAAGSALYALIDDTGFAAWEELLSLNLTSAFALSRAFAPAMRWRRWGRLVFLSSVWGVTGAAGEAAYAAAKGGLNALTKSLARELAPAGVTVNAIAAGAIDTAMLAPLGGEERAALAADIPLGRLGTAAETAELVCYLASEQAGYVTGQVIGLNGGWHM